jgi:hypothetical protein
MNVDTNSIAYIAGRYVGALVLTGLVTRGALAFFRKREPRSSAPVLSFLTGALLVLGFRCLAAVVGASPEDGDLRETVGPVVVMFVELDLPCLLVWLGFDMYRARRRGRADEPDRGRASRTMGLELPAATMIDGYRRSYKLGAAFVVVEVCAIVGDVSTLVEGSPLPAVVATTLSTSILLAGSAAVRTRWSWHALLGGLLGRFVVGFYFTHLSIGHFGWPPPWALLAVSVVKLTDLLWFGYFYRRRALFGAQLRWHWIERTVPILGRPDTSPARMAPTMFLAAGVFGLSRRATILLALGATLLLLAVYPFLLSLWA